jgi:hypothetical protein
MRVRPVLVTPDGAWLDDRAPTLRGLDLADCCLCEMLIHQIYERPELVFECETCGSAYLLEEEWSKC